MMENVAEIGEDIQTAEALPPYALELSAFHQAFTAELRFIIGALPLAPTMRVLDVGCGDGYYTALLAERLIAPGCVVGLDSNSAYLRLAREHVASCSTSCEVRFVEGRLSDIPLQRDSFDLLWCAQSLYSLPDPVESLRQMRAMLRPGGLLVVLENDTLHQLLLPWPPQMEIVVRAAEFVSLYENSSRPSKFYVGRRLPSVFAAAGLEPLGFKTQCIDRQAPLEASLEAFLQSYLTRLAERIGSNMPPALEAEFKGLMDPAHPNHFLRQPHFTLSWINVLAWGRRPDERIAANLEQFS